MEVLARNYSPVTVEGIHLFLAGKKTLPRKPVAVTFDDGYADNPEVAAPVLNRLGIPASFYLTVESVDTGRAPWFCHLRHAFTATRKRSWLDPTGRSWDLADGARREPALSAVSEHLTRLVGSAQQEALQAIERHLDVEPLAPKKQLMMTWEQAKCASCDWPILRVKLPTGKVVAYDDDLTPHFKTCPEAALFRKDRKRHGR